MKIKYYIDNGGYKPTKAHSTDAGFDLYAPRDYLPGQNIVDTKVHILIPAGYVGLIFPRSSMSKRGFITHTGVIDAGYTGTIKINLEYQGIDTETHYRAGQRIAQLVIVPLPAVELVEDDFSGLQTERGSKGFGSSGR